MGCGISSNEGNKIITNFWGKLLINEITAKDYINKINKSDISKLYNQHEEFNENIIFKYISTNKSSSQYLMFTDMIIRNQNNQMKIFEQKALDALLFSLLLLTKDFNKLSPLELNDFLIEFFNSINSVKSYLVKVNEHYYINMFNVLYFSSFFVNLVSLGCIKYVSHLADNKKVFSDKYSNYFSVENQNFYLLDCVNDIILDLNNENFNPTSSVKLEDKEFNGLVLLNELNFIQKSVIYKNCPLEVYNEDGDIVNVSNSSIKSNIFSETDCLVPFLSFIKIVSYLKEPQEIRKELKLNYKV